VLRYIGRRLLATVLVLLAASLLTFLLVGRTVDPIGPLRLHQPPPSEATLANLREHLYLDRALPERYWLWLTGIGDTHGDIGLLRGRWGPSVNGTDIGGELRHRFAVTFRLVAAALVLAVALAVVTGIVGGARPRSRTDRALSGFAYLAMAVPLFWLGALVKQGGVWINDLVGHRVFWTLGATAPDHPSLGTLGRIGDIAGHLALPTLTLVLGSYALVSRQQRAALMVSLGSDYVRTARAKGLRERAVVLRHALRPALSPTVSLSALLVAEALAGSVIVERIFRWRGMGTFLLDALTVGDAYAVLGYLVVVGVVVSLANLAADVMQAALDPRVRGDERE
jgi:peptide/nickel transport system permease protein